MFLLVFLTAPIFANDSIGVESAEDKYVICDLEDRCCEIDSSVAEGLEWRFGAKQFFKCSFSYFFGTNEEDYNECRRIVGNEFWGALAEHVNQFCDF